MPTVTQDSRLNRRNDPAVRPLWTAADVAARFGWHPVTVRRKAAAGEIPCVHIGRSLRFRPEELEEVLE